MKAFAPLLAGFLLKEGVLENFLFDTQLQSFFSIPYCIIKFSFISSKIELFLLKTYNKNPCFKIDTEGFSSLSTFPPKLSNLHIVKELFDDIINMYTQRCFSSKITKIVLTVSAILVAIMSIAHFTYAGLFGRLLNLYGDSFFMLDKNLFEKLYAPPIAYFTICGVAQIATNAVYLLLLWQFIRFTKTTLGITIGLLIFEFGMNFTIAVWSSMSWTYYDGLWKEYLNWTEQYISGLDSRWKIFVQTIVSLFKLSAAESILTFIIVLPAIIIQILMFLDKNTSYSYLEEKQIVPAPDPTFDQIEIKQK